LSLLQGRWNTTAAQENYELYEALYWLNCTLLYHSKRYLLAFTSRLYINADISIGIRMYVKVSFWFCSWCQGLKSKYFWLPSRNGHTTNTDNQGPALKHFSTLYYTLQTDAFSLLVIFLWLIHFKFDSLHWNYYYY